MIEAVIAGITAFNISYADLPDTALSYDGTARDVSNFYSQSVPNFHLAGRYALQDRTALTWSLDTGTHVKKLNTLGFGLGLSHRIPTSYQNTYWTVSGSSTVSLMKHKPCTDSYNREYYCGNLTAWSDFEDKSNAKFKNKIGVSWITRW